MRFYWNIKKCTRGVSLVLVFLVLVSVFWGAFCPVTSWADEVSDLKSSIEQKQQEIKEAERQKNQLKTGLTDVQAMIEDLERSKNSLAAYVSQLDGNLAEIQAKISELSELIAQKEEEIVQTEAEIEQALAREQAQYEAMKGRIKSIYERGDNFYIETLLSAKSFGDMLNQAEYIKKLADSDKRTFDKYQAAREYTQVCKAQLESEQELLDEAKKNVEAEQKSLEGLIAEKEAEISTYEADINNREQLVKEYEAEIAAQNEEIKALESAAKALQKQLEQAGKKKTYDGGMFAWPAPSYTRISDDYGNRMHPTLHVEKFHNGVDMAAPGGSPILAAYNGTVIAASYSSSMGNYIMIDHGDNLYTIYMHASALYVSQGTEVVKGQKIAAVGTTGRSTGNHLHFGVRLNGNYVSPWNYLK